MTYVKLGSSSQERIEILSIFRCSMKNRMKDNIPHLESIHFLQGDEFLIFFLQIIVFDAANCNLFQNS